MRNTERLVLVGPAEPQHHGVPTPLYTALDWLGNARNLAPVALFIQPDEDTEITRMAAALGILVFEQRMLKTPLGRRRLQALRPDWLLSLHGSLLLPADLLDIPRQGSINVHPGKLPEYAGHDTAQWAIRNGEDRFGVSAHWLEPEMNKGDLIFTEHFPVGPEDTGLDVLQTCSELCSQLAVRVLETIERGDPLPRTPQDLSRRRLYHVTDAADGRIDWTRPAREIRNFVRAADCGPHASSSYIPESCLDGGKVLIRKATMLDITPGDAEPGQVIAVDADGVHVACGQDALLVREVEPATGPRAGQRLTGDAIASVLGISQGDTFH